MKKTLSDKSEYGVEDPNVNIDDIEEYHWYYEKDVKDFIQKLKEFIDNLRMSTHAFMGKKEGDIFRDFMKEEIDTLAGDKLVNQDPNKQVVDLCRETIKDTKNDLCECGRARINHPSESCKKYKKFKAKKELPLNKQFNRHYPKKAKKGCVECDETGFTNVGGISYPCPACSGDKK